MVCLDSRDELRGELLELARNELNVHQLDFVESVDELLTCQLLPNNKLLGPRFGERFPAVRAALATLDVAAARARLREGGLSLDVQGERIELAEDEVLVREQPREGLSVSSAGGIHVAVDTVLTSELIAEGLAREVVRRVQTLRKNANLNLDDRIVTFYQADGALAEAIEQWRDTIGAETLSTELSPGHPEDGMITDQYQVDGQTLGLGVRKVEACEDES
jgi:isoleucyl-tRNA synthetase